MINDAKKIAGAIARACEAEGMVNLARLLGAADVSIAQVGYDNWDGGTDLCECVVEVSPEVYGEIGEDRAGLEKQLLNRMQPISRRYQGEYLTSVIIVPKLDERPIESTEDGKHSELRRLVGEQRKLMVEVAVGGPRIDDVNKEYQARRSEIRKLLAEIGAEDPNPFSDLWEWYGRWSSGDLPNYASRRQFIAEMYKPLVDALDLAGPGSRNRIVVRPTGWARVDRGIGEARTRLSTANHEEQFQEVGMLCRETLISLAQEVFDPERHPVEDGVVVSSTDAYRMLAAFFNVELSGSRNKEQRKHAKAALEVANKTTHDRSADFRKAALCEEATTSVINSVAIMSGRRDPQ
ncbi:MAG: hypothetical protein KOO63_00260 [Bacteroidales bacterium]|nr:hypothetical protein [Candidatus Latescibacterota bacterium]